MGAYERLAEKHGYRHSGWYRRILEFLMTPAQAEVADALPGSFEEVAAKTGLSIEEVKVEIDALFRKGVVISKDFHTLEGARFCPDVMRLHDATEASRLTGEIYGEKAPHLWRLWEEFCQKEYYAELARIAREMEVPPTRIVPVYRTIQDIPGISPYDDVREILKAAPLIAVVPCSCRSQAEKKDVIVEACIQLGRNAEYAIARGSGRQIDYAEALAIVDKADDDGAIHRTTNWQSLSWGLLSSCTKDACLILTPLFQYGVPIDKRVEKSRFEASVNEELCNGCEVCVARCQFDAIEMVQSHDSKGLKALIDPEKCWGCGSCVIKCEPEALSLRLVRPLDYIPAEKPAAYRHT